MNSDNPNPLLPLADIARETSFTFEARQGCFLLSTPRDEDKNYFIWQVLLRETLPETEPIEKYWNYGYLHDVLKRDGLQYTAYMKDLQIVVPDLVSSELPRIASFLARTSHIATTALYVEQNDLCGYLGHNPQTDGKLARIQLKELSRPQVRETTRPYADCVDELLQALYK